MLQPTHPPQSNYSIETIIRLFHIDGLVQEKRNSSALAMELRLSCTHLSLCQFIVMPRPALYWHVAIHANNCWSCNEYYVS